MRLILILLSLFSLVCSAQVEINSEQLDGTKWRRVDSLNNHREETITFSSTRMTGNVVYKKVIQSLKRHSFLNITLTTLSIQNLIPHS